MTLTRTHIGAIVMRVQNAFLAAPALNLQLPDAARRFGLDIATCREILETLLAAGVLTKTPEGAYARA
jgi:DNA-binding IclR family transcriptional regulator